MEESATAVKEKCYIICIMAVRQTSKTPTTPHILSGSAAVEFPFLKNSKGATQPVTPDEVSAEIQKSSRGQQK